MLPDPERFVLFRELDIFRPVPQPALEQLVAAAAVPLRVEAGEVLIREGDVGDRFYVVTSGHLEVEHGGQMRRRRSGRATTWARSPLLRDVPRTATVVGTASRPTCWRSTATRSCWR